MKPIQCVISDPVHIEQINRANKVRKFPKLGRAVRELALERARQIKDYGDVPLVPSRQPQPS
jgi:hypothetical protein